MSEVSKLPVASWLESNQVALVAALGEVRAQLEAGTSDAAPEIPGGDSALATLCATFKLTRFERALLLLCAGIELDSAFAPLCAKLNGDPTCAYPTFSLALGRLPDPHWSALSPDGALRRWLLVDVVRQPGVSLTASALRIDERILHYLTGLNHTDERVANLAEPLSADGLVAPAHESIVAAVCEEWSHARALPAIQLGGRDAGAKREIAAAAGSALGIRFYALRPELFAAQGHLFETLARLWDREAALSGAALYVDADGLDAAETAPHVRRLVERLAAPLVLAAPEPWPLTHRATRVFDVAKPPAPEQRELWVRFLGPDAERASEQIDRVAGQFDLGAVAIRAAALEARTAGAAPLSERLWDAARARARTQLGALAQQVRTDVTFADLVLPERHTALLREIAMHVAQRATVYGRWGFDHRTTSGLGISALFAGPSGTGKTMAAAVLANALRLDLYRIDLATVVNKYIGETEKNLRRVFDAAEDGGAILFFDEADALFGKRSEVKDSHDRYANIEINYLLQRIESYRGLAILATNMKSALDEAFLRRLRFVVEFPFPDAAQRQALWRTVFPPSAPLEDLAFERLALLNVPGGNIRNIALRAAFLAADAGEPIRMSHLRRAALGEYLKLERPANEVDGAFGAAS
ncbi:MAG: ATP-binding protein [Candidatus Eremiobacteraeota bacterium]|nr:ATP-binding protein [Candidatus Eremiobacteraeota bacterium]